MWNRCVDCVINVLMGDEHVTFYTGVQALSPFSHCQIESFNSSGHQGYVEHCVGRTVWMRHCLSDPRKMQSCSTTAITLRADIVMWMQQKGVQKTCKSTSSSVGGTAGKVANIRTEHNSNCACTYINARLSRLEHSPSIHAGIAFTVKLMELL